MREILFRGKRVDNGEWVYGYLFASKMSGAFILSSQIDIRGNRSGGMTMRDKLTQHEVDPATVGQYTGLKDKNGKEIYEGDVMQTYFSFAPGDAGYGVSQRPFVVKWEQGRTAFRAFKPKTNSRHILDTVDFFEMQSKIYEVIGNIHDNPELLEASR